MHVSLFCFVLFCFFVFFYCKMHGILHRFAEGCLGWSRRHLKYLVHSIAHVFSMTQAITRARAEMSIGLYNMYPKVMLCCKTYICINVHLLIIYAYAYAYMMYIYIYIYTYIWDRRCRCVCFPFMGNLNPNTCTGLILCLRLANERHRYKVTPHPIGRVQT